MSTERLFSHDVAIECVAPDEVTKNLSVVGFDCKQLPASALYKLLSYRAYLMRKVGQYVVVGMRLNWQCGADSCTSTDVLHGKVCGRDFLD